MSTSFPLCSVLRKFKLRLLGSLLFLILVALSVAQEVTVHDTTRHGTSPATALDTTAQDITPLTEPSEVRSGELLFATPAPGRFRPATRLSTDVTLEVGGMVARVTVAQAFENTGSAWAEAVYVFPLPEDAAVDTLRLRVGERVIVGEIRAREEAEATYEAAKEAGQHASLVEQERPNLFTTSVANVAPGERVVVEIAYSERLRFDSGSFRLRFPLAITPRYSPGQPLALDASYEPDRSGWATATDAVPDAARITPPYRRPNETLDRNSTLPNSVTLHAEVKAGFPLQTLTSSHHTVTTEQDGDVYRLELSGPVPADRDFELVWTPEVGSSPGAAVFTETLDTRYGLLMLLPPSVPQNAPPPPREMVLVIDTSGSMAGISIDQAKTSLRLALDRLRPQDRFNIIEFNSSASQLFGASRLADAAALRQAERFVGGLRADGGTEMAPALRLAFRDEVPAGYLRQVVFVTDGSVGNETELFGLLAQTLGAGRLFTVGIGAAPNSYFMRKAAEFGRGTYTFIADVAEVQEKMNALFTKLETPVLTGMKVTLPAGAEAYPATVPDLYAGEPVVMSVKLPGTGGEVVLQGNVGEHPWTRRLSLPGSGAQPGDQPGVAQLWARAKIEALSDEEVRGGDAAELRAAIRQLALRHSLVTAYTSLVAVDKTPARPVGEGLEQDHVPQTLPYGQDYDAIFGAPGVTVGYPATATSAPLNFAVSLAAFALACLLLWRARRQELRA